MKAPNIPVSAETGAPSSPTWKRPVSARRPPLRRRKCQPSQAGHRCATSRAHSSGRGREAKQTATVAPLKEQAAGHQRRSGPAGGHAEAGPRTDRQAGEIGGGLDGQPGAHRRDSLQPALPARVTDGPGDDRCDVEQAEDGSDRGDGYGLGLGLGLGLAIVNTVVHAHHATLITGTRPEGGLTIAARFRRR